MLFKTRLWRGLIVVFTFVLSIAIMAAIILEQFRTSIDNLTGSHSEVIETTDGDNLFKEFVPPAEVLNADGTGNSNKLIAEFIKFGRRLSQEGSVLLKNEEVDGKPALPLSSGSKVTLLGLRSLVPIMGSALGQPIEGPVITLEDALGGTKTDFANPEKTTSGNASTINNYNFSDVGGEGAGFELNPDMLATYRALKPDNIAYSGVTSRSTFSSVNVKYDPQEPSLADIERQDPDYEESFADYDDAAIVVVGRPSSENNDYLPGNVVEDTHMDEPLALSQNEVDIINKATECFDNVIVIVNTTSPMELGEIADNPDVSAVLWVGHFGNYGALGIADILSGKVSPSGALADIYVDRNMSHPALVNVGDYRFSNQAEGARSSKYVIEAEGMYVGYRYFETRYNDIVEGRGNADSAVGAVASEGNWRYNEEVTWPFGYGLTYTQFEQTFVGEPVVTKTEHEFTIEFKVDVANVGDVAAKSIVQIYGQAPYIDGGLEKSAVQLLDYDKTETLAPGEHEELTIKVDLQNIATWDSSHENADGTYGTYILDVGDYYFTLGNGSHEAMNNILAKQGKTVENTSGLMDADGDSDLVFQYTYDNDGKNAVDDITFSVSKAGANVSNQIPYADWNHYEEGKVTYLSRSDWTGTWPREYVNMAAPASMQDDLDGKYYELKTDDDTSDILFETISEEGELNFIDLKFADYDDPRWDTLLAQMSVEEAMGVIAAGGNNFRNIRSIGFTGGAYTENSGNGVALTLAQYNFGKAPWTIQRSDDNIRYELEVFATAPTVASSFNPDLHYELGKMVGLQALFVGMPILWGPGMNTHRHPYNGRSGDYYSEDPILTGNIGLEFSMGALEYGLIAAPKHYAFNDQETNRGGVAPFLTEQRAREIELRAFQIAIEGTKYDTEEKDVGMLGLMISLSKVGAVECSASYGMMTGILRNEWGFHGYAVTDIGDDMDLFTAVVAAGTTGYDVRGAYKASGFDDYESLADGVVPSPELYKGDAHILSQLKTAAKNVLYVFTQSNLMNAFDYDTYARWNMTWYRALYISLISVSGVLLIADCVLYIVGSMKKNKNKEAID